MAAEARRPDPATLLAFLGVALFGGLNTIAAKVTVAELAPLWSAGTRFVAAGLIFAVLTLATGRPFPRGRGLSGAMLYGAAGYAGAFGLLYPAVREIPAGTVGVIIALAPLTTFALAVVQRQERFQALALVGGLIAVAGVAIVFVDQLSASAPPWALGLALVGVLFLSEAGVIAKWIPRSDPLATNAVAMVTAGAIGIAASILLGETRAIPVQTDTWIAIAYIVVFGSVVMFGLYLFGIERWSASGMAYSTLLLPFVSVTAASLLTGEAFSPAFAVGGVVMVVGVYVGAFLAHRPKRSTATAMPECVPMADCAAQIPAALRSAGSAER
ncbi:MAG TPA: EamA family transporter [Candidatus Deferrimicrobiaceae bacterium]|nr:EamA family transporter [Candidatus Deferrimicrobiaceae bacterium]